MTLNLRAEDNQDLTSFCFEKNVSLSVVVDSLKVLMLPRDIIEKREEDNCIDLIAPPNRANLFEKFLIKRYSLIKDVKPSLNNIDQQCLLELKTTKKMKRVDDQLKLGSKNSLKSSETEMTQVSSMDLLIGSGIPGELTAGPQQLSVICKIFGEKAQLIFSFSEKEKASVKTEIMIKKNEWLNIASVIQELNDKVKTLGIPQSELGSAKGVQETIYEIQFK